MKKYLSLIMAVALLGAITGCTTTNPTTGQKEIDIVKTEKVAAVMQQTIASATLIGIQKEPKAAPYLKAASLVLADVSNQQDLSPQALLAALQSANIKELQTIEAQIVVNTVVGLYGAAYADRLHADVQANIYAKTILETLAKGMSQGIGQAKAAGLIQ